MFSCFTTLASVFKLNFILILVEIILVYLLMFSIGVLVQPEWWWRGKRARTRAWAWIYTSRTGPQGKIVWFIFQTSWIMFIFQSLLIIPLSPPFIRMYLKWAYLWSVLLVCHDDFFLVLYLASFTGKLSRSSSSFVFLLFSVK